MEAWQEAFDHLKDCLDELENAMHLGDQARIRQCRRWSNEAESHEREAYKEAIVSMK